ncbi:MAG: efflux RND transporter permease subunit [Gammaproteobacteria bacterium]
MRITRIAIDRPVFTVMVFCGMVAFGLASIPRLGIDLFPKIDLPYVGITTTLKGAAPETLDTDVTDIIEEAVNTVSGIEQLRSESGDGYSQISVVFKLEEKLNEKIQDVRDKIETIRRDLPQDADPPTVEKADPDAIPILSIVVGGDRSIGEITRYANEVIKEAVERIPGVGAVRILGGRKREVRIWLDTAKLRAHGVSADQVVQAIRNEHADLPGGRMEPQGARYELGARTLAKARKVQEFERMPVAFRDNGVAITIGDVAAVEDGLEDERTYATLNGAPAVSLEVRRQSGRNSVDVARRVRAEVNRLRNETPPGMSLVVARDVSRFISSSIHDVAIDIGIATLLVVVVVFLFLASWRATLMVAVAIPTCLITTLFSLYLFNFTINIITLLGATIAIGLLVDDAIVVVESIQRDVEAGLPRFEAAWRGTVRVALPVLAGTFATLAVFVPVVFMGGLAGRFLFQYALVIVFSISISLFVSLTLTPMLASRFLLPAAKSKAWLRNLDHWHHRLGERYGVVVAWATAHPGIVITLALASLVAGHWFATHIPSSFVPKSDRSEFLASIKLPLGTGIAESKQVAADVNRALASVTDIRDVLLTIGAGVQQRANFIEAYIGITPKQDRSVAQFAIMDAARAAIATSAPHATEITVSEVPWISGGGVGSADIEFSLRGADLGTISTYAQAITREMAHAPELTDVRSSYEAGRPELAIRLRRERAADVGVSARALADTTRVLIGGVEAGSFEENGRRYDVRVRLAADQRATIDQLSLMQVRANDGRLIDVPSVADLDVGTGPVTISRQDRSRSVTIYAGTPGNVALGPATAAVEAIIAKIPPPPGVSIVFGGYVKRFKDTIGPMRIAFISALIAVYMVLASQLNSFGQPAIIMLTAPMSFSGAFAAVWLANNEMSLFGQVGLIALMGIVMKNGILLVDLANQLRQNDGLSRRVAMERAGAERLRPVLMTACAAVFGALPIALANSDAAEWRNSMGLLIVGGLASSTLLTLLLIPAVYCLPDQIGKLVARIRAHAQRTNLPWPPLRDVRRSPEQSAETVAIHKSRSN